MKFIGGDLENFSLGSGGTAADGALPDALRGIAFKALMSSLMIARTWI
jgi:hypothetical protein